MVKAEVPGIDPGQDVEITLTGNQLHLDVRREEKSAYPSPNNPTQPSARYPSPAAE